MEMAQPNPEGSAQHHNKRPQTSLSLIEVLRKLWNGIQVRKVWPLLAKYNLLHNSQNAYMRNKGCKDATIQIINALEEAEQAATLIALSSWDFTRAFDSVSHIASKLSLYRFGLPPFRGGVLRYADKLGLQNIVKKLQNFEIKYGERFAVSNLLISMAQNNQKFYN